MPSLPESPKLTEARPELQRPEKAGSTVNVMAQEIARLRDLVRLLRGELEALEKELAEWS
jgi:hypothetical protein